MHPYVTNLDGGPGGAALSDDRKIREQMILVIIRYRL